MPDQGLVWNQEWPLPENGAYYTAEETIRYARMAEELGWGQTIFPAQDRRRRRLSPASELSTSRWVAGIEERAEAAAITFEESDNSQFNRINEWLLREAPFLDNGWSKPYVNEYAFSFRHDHGHWPVLGDLVGNADFVMGASNPHLRSLLPDTFIVMSDTAPPLRQPAHHRPQYRRDAPAARMVAKLGRPAAGRSRLCPRPPELRKTIPIISQADLDQTMAEYSRLLSQATYSGGRAAPPRLRPHLLEENIAPNGRLCCWKNRRIWAVWWTPIFPKRPPST